MKRVLSRVFGAVWSVVRPVALDAFAFARWVVRGLPIVLGRWSPPQWLRWLGGWLARRLEPVVAWARRRPKTAVVLGLVLATAGVAPFVVPPLLDTPPPPPPPGVHLVSFQGRAPGLTPLVEGATPGPIGILFSESAARIEDVGKVVARGIELTPAVRGTWRWTSDTELVFTPAEDWGVGQRYSVRFAPSLFPPHVRLVEDEFTFTSASFVATLREWSLVQDPVAPERKEVVATLAFSHPVDARDLEGRVHLALQNPPDGSERPHRFRVTYDRFRGQAYLRSDLVPVPLEDQWMQITVDAGVRSSRGGEPTEAPAVQRVRIPGRYNLLRVSDVDLSVARNERDELDQLVFVRLSTDVAPAKLPGKIAACLLPVDRPAIDGEPAVPNYAWASPAEIGPEVTRRCTRVALERVAGTEPGPGEPHVFRYQAEPRRSLYFTVRQGLESTGGYVLARQYDAVLRVPEFPRELAILHEGAILSATGDKKLSIMARNLEAVRFEIGRVLPGEVEHLVSQTEGTFSGARFGWGAMQEDDVVERFSEVRPLDRGQPGRAQYAAFDFSRHVTAAAGGEPKRGIFFLSVESWDTATRSSTGLSDRRLVLVTDLGVLVKDAADGTHHVFVQSFRTGGPVAAARVEVLGRNGVAVASSTTDGEGRASIPALADFTRERAPTVYLVRSGEDLSFLPYGRMDRRLDFSRFDVGGVRMPTGPAPMRAFPFSDRGLYRPGDVAHLAAIVKAPDWSGRLEGVPLEAVVADPRGVEVYKERVLLPASGFLALDFETEPSAPTGTYRFGLYVVRDDRRGSLLGSLPLRIEEFLPDPMRMTARLVGAEGPRSGWLSPAGLEAEIDLASLFGAPSADRRVTAHVSAAPTAPSFPAVRDYTFFDASDPAPAVSQNLDEATTDDEGKATFGLDVADWGSAVYELTFTAQGFTAEGGRSVSASAEVLVSTREMLLGYRADGDLYYVGRGSRRVLDLVAIDARLRKVPAPGLQAELLSRRWVSVLVRQPNGTYRYQSTLREVPVDRKRVSVAARGSSFVLDTTTPGDFVVVFRDAEGSVLGRVSYTVAGEANLAGRLDRAAELRIALNKADYAPGEEIELQIVAPYVGAGLITIERDRVYAHRWFRTTQNASTQRIRIPREMEANGYVSVAFVRALDSEEIYTSPLSYGVAGFSLSRQGRSARVTIETPDRAQPGEPLAIQYTTDRPSKIAVFAVDEGILQVAAYRTPDPLGFFFQKRALEVGTAQILDQLLPEYGLVRRLAAGGDEETDDGAADLQANLNPFRRKQEPPVVFWSGIVDADATPRTLRFDVPDYFAGTLRVMAVAAAPDAVGAAERKTIVRGPFVLSPTAPTAVAPGDEFEVGLGVFNGVEGSGDDANVTLAIATSEHIELVGAARRPIAVAEDHEAQASIRFKAKPVLGSGRITFTASLGNKRVQRSWELSVRPSAPFMTTFAWGTVQSGRADVLLPRKLYAEHRRLEVFASPVPLALAGGLARHVEDIPHASTEAIASQAAVALVLRSRPELGVPREQAEARLDRALRILRARQNGEGAFGVWAANAHVSDFQTVHALMVLTEAKDRGAAVPRETLQRGLEALRPIVGRRVTTLTQARLAAYAAYVLTRNGVLVTGDVEALADAMRTRLGPEWTRDLAAIHLAATQKLMRQDRRADELISAVRLGDPLPVDPTSYYDASLRDAQLLYVLARHFPRRLEGIGAAQLRQLLGPLSGEAPSTIYAAWATLALDAYAAAVPAPSPANLRVTERGAGGEERVVTLPAGLFPRGVFTDRAASLRIESALDAPLFYQVLQAGFDRAAPTEAITKRLEVYRELRENGQAITRTKLGSEIEVHVRLRTVDRSTAHDVAIVDPLPGGFEVVVEPPDDAAEEPEVDVADDDTGDAYEDDPYEGEEGQEGEEGEEGEESPVGDEPSSLGAAGGPRVASPGSTWSPEYVDVREDRVVFYGSVGPNVTELVYRIRATSRGTFTVPPVFGDALYDRTTRARSAATRITVE